MAYSQEKIKSNFPLNKLRNILEKDGKNYTDQQLIEIRDLLIQLAEINYDIFIHNDQKEKQQGD